MKRTIGVLAMVNFFDTLGELLMMVSMPYIMLPPPPGCAVAERPQPGEVCTTYIRRISGR